MALLVSRGDEKQNNIKGFLHDFERTAKQTGLNIMLHLTTEMMAERLGVL